MYRVQDTESLRREEEEHQHGQKEEKRNKAGSEVQQIPDLETELRTQTESNPKKVYLNHCENFAKENFEEDRIPIDPYDLNYTDMEKKHTFAEYEPIDVETAFRHKNGIDGLPQNISTRARGKIYVEQLQAQNTSIASMNNSMQKRFSIQSPSTEVNRKFLSNRGIMGMGMDTVQQNKRLKDIVVGYSVIDVKLSTEVILCHGRQHMLVKTWEKVRHDEQCLVFQIKTMRIFDCMNAEPKTILTEQIDGNFKLKSFHDTSTLLNGSKLYYFKRIQKFTEASTALVEMGDAEGMINESGSVDLPSDSALSADSHSQLQLYVLDMNAAGDSDREFVDPKTGDGYQLVEYAPAMDDPEDMQFNVTFSTEFGASGKKYKTESEFLDSQYFVVQKYIEEKGNSSFALYRMDKMEDPIHVEFSDVYQEDLEGDETVVTDEDFDPSLTEQIQYLRHKVLETDKDGNPLSIIFILVSNRHHLHLLYDAVTQEMSSVDKYPAREITKLSLPNIHVQAHKMEIPSKSGEGLMEEVPHYFFMDSKNEVQLMYPDYKSKSRKFEIIDQLKRETGIVPADYRNFKRIIIQEYNANAKLSDSCRTSIQKIDDLKKLLNHRNINKDQILLFVKDTFDQVLYISQTDLPSIVQIQMRDHHCEEIYTDDEATADHLRGNIKALFAIGGAQQVSKKGRKSATRQKKMMNSIHTRQPIGTTLAQTGDETAMDCVTIDIDTQDIIISKAVDGFEERNCLAKHGNKAPLRLQQIQKNSEEFLALQEKYNIQARQKNTVKYIMMEDKNGKVRKIQCYDTRSRHQNLNIEELKAELVVRAEDYFMFVLSAVRYINNHKTMSYLFLRRKVAIVHELIAESMNSEKKKLASPHNLIPDNQEFQVIMPGQQFQKLKLENLMDFMSEEEESRIRLTFETYQDMSTCMDFLVFLYQDKTDIDENSLVIYDIEEQQITRKIVINPNKVSTSFLSKDEQGFNCFKLVRTDDKQIYASANSAEGDYSYCFNYSVFAFYNAKLGRIQVQQFHIRQNWQGLTSYDDNERYQVALIGMKQLFMSEKCVINTDWQFLKNSNVVPFLDADGSYGGCSIILAHGRGRISCINLMESAKKNNLYSYVSVVLSVGRKRFELSAHDPEDYIIVISSLLRMDQIDMFDQSETYAMLRSSQQLLMAMRIPDLEYILLNTFDQLRKQDFFACQEILLGKSLGDICLNTPKFLKEALATYKEKPNPHEQKSLAYQIINNDQIRREVMRETAFAIQERVINWDFNFYTTVYRAIFTSSLQSLTHIMQFVGDEEKDAKLSQMYTDLLMLDFTEILENKSEELSFFLNEPERLSGNASIQSNMETEITSTKLPKFSKNPQNFMQVKEIESIHEVKDEIIDRLCQYQQDQKEDKSWKLPSLFGESSAEYPIEYAFIDFKWLRIGEKLKHMDQPVPEHKPLFDDDYFATLIMKQEDDLDFFGNSVIQRIIDYQFEQSTRSVMLGIFYLYLLFFVCPYVITLISDDPTIVMQVYKICLMPQILLLCIEMVQMYENGWEYFNSFWNFIDITQIVVFQILLMIRIDEFSTGEEWAYTPFMKIFLLVLTFLKTLHFVGVYEELGFFIDMLIACMSKLGDFFVSYVAFGLGFAVIYQVVGAETDSEIASAVGLGDFGRLYLLIWRQGVGKLGMAAYPKLMEKPDSMLKYVNIGLIWFVYFVQVMFQLVFGLNFIIAILESNYKEIAKQRNNYIYRAKANLNEECYQLLKHVSKLESFRGLIFAVKCTEEEQKFAPTDEDQFFGMSNKFESMFAEMFSHQMNSYDEFIHALVHYRLAQEKFHKNYKQDMELYQKHLEETKQKWLDAINGDKQVHPQKAANALSAKLSSMHE